MVFEIIIIVIFSTVVGGKFYYEIRRAVPAFYKKEINCIK